jgi:hypothetical protein
VKLPADAYIAREEVTHYLLVKRSVGEKSEFLKRAGCTLQTAQQLERDIRTQILTREAVATKNTQYGQHYEIRARLTGPNKITLQVKTVWMREVKTGLTKFITLHPDKEEVP